jgi:hypothetical protein
MPEKLGVFYLLLVVTFCPLTDSVRLSQCTGPDHVYLGLNSSKAGGKRRKPSTEKKVSRVSLPELKPPRAAVSDLVINAPVAPEERDQFGLFPLHADYRYPCPPKKIPVDIVAVHGITGDAYSYLATWR